MDNLLTFRQGLCIACVILCLFPLESLQATDMCANTWITYPNSSVSGGSYASDIVLVKKCQERCLNVSDCNGIDFDGASRCWLIKSAAAPKDDPTKRVTHYDLRKGVTSCTADCTATSDTNAITWRQTKDSHVAGANVVKNVTFDGCLITCRDDVDCYAFDWNEVEDTDKCWIISSSNVNKDNLQAMSGVRNFKKDCFYGGIRIVTPIVIPPGERGVAGATTPGYDVAEGRVVADYISGDVFTIKPAYIVLLGLGLGCILLVVIAILVICIYPLKGARKMKFKKFSIRKSTSTKTSKNKKLRNESGELHTRRPKALGEDEIIGMHPTKTSLYNSNYDTNKYDAHKEYNHDKKQMDAMYSETKIRDSYDDNTKKIRDTYSDAKTPYHHNPNGTLDHNPLPAYTAHHDNHLDSLHDNHLDSLHDNHIDSHQRHSLDMPQRHSLDMDGHGGRTSPVHLIEDKYRDSKHSNYDKIEDEIHDVMDNPTFKKDEDFD